MKVTIFEDNLDSNRMEMESIEINDTLELISFVSSPYVVVNKRMFKINHGKNLFITDISGKILNVFGYEILD